MTSNFMSDVDATVSAKIESLVRLLEEETAKNGCEGRPTGSAACNFVLETIKNELQSICTCIELEAGAGLVCTLHNHPQNSNSAGPLIMSHVDFHPQHRKRAMLSMETGAPTLKCLDGVVDRCYDNTGGIAILLRLISYLHSQRFDMQGPLHLAFLTGGDMYSMSDTMIDERRVNGHGPRYLVQWLQTSSSAPTISCAISVYASIYEPCQREFELNAAVSSMGLSFHCFDIVGAGFALGTLAVGLDPDGGRLSVNIPHGNSQRSTFDTVFLRAYNNAKTSLPISSNGRLATYIVPRCQPPIIDQMYQTLRQLGVPLVRIDAPSLLPDTPSPFAAIQDVVFKSVHEIVKQPRHTHNLYFETHTCTKIYSDSLSAAKQSLDNDNDIEKNAVTANTKANARERGCSLQ